MMKRFSVGVIALLLTIIGLTAHPARADTSAKEQALTVTLNKRIWTDQLPSVQENTGWTTADFGGTPLAGVTFDVYDATALYREAMKAPDFQAKSWMRMWSEKSREQIQQTGVKQPLTAGTTNREGQVTFHLTQTDATAYLFVETRQIASGYEQTAAIKSAPLMLLLPYYSEATAQPLQSIMIYLKNIGIPVKPTEPIKPIEPKQPTLSKKGWSDLPSTGQAKSLLALLGALLLLLVLGIVWHNHKSKKTN